MTPSRQEKKIFLSEAACRLGSFFEVMPAVGSACSVLVSDAGAERVCTKHLSRVVC